MADGKREAEKQISEYFALKLRKQAVDEKFKEAQRQFYSRMSKFFKSSSIDRDYSFSDFKSGQKRDFKLVKVQQKKVTFDPSKVKQALGKELSSEVIKKEVSIPDADKFIKYMKHVGADPKTVKSMLLVSESVDVKALDQLIDVGDIDEQLLDGTFEVIEKDPYFKVTMSVDEQEDADDEEWDK